MRLPDFLIGGAPRSGTTWLYRLLERHPDVYLAKPVTPEPKFFLVDSLYEQGLRHYSATWFADVGDARAAGEKSTNYLESETAASRIARDLPGVKLVFILRDPADRAYSNYLWSRMNGLETESFAVALDRETQREAELPERYTFARPFSYFSRGLYADLLAPYFAGFSREQILVLKYEDIAATAEAVAARLHRFLDVDQRPADARVLGVVNPSEAGDSTFDEGLRRELRARYEEPNRRLAALVGPDFDLWK